MYYSPAAMVSSTTTPLFSYTGALTLCSRSVLRPERPSLSILAILTELNATNCFAFLAMILLQKLEGAKNGHLPSLKAAV